MDDPDCAHPGTWQVLVHVIWESGHWPPTIGAFARPSHVVRMLATT